MPNKAKETATDALGLILFLAIGLGTLVLSMKLGPVARFFLGI